MAKSLTFGEAARLIRDFNKEKNAAVLRGIDLGMRVPLRLSVTKYMEGLGSGESGKPPNPPPGPIGIRKGRLRRAVRIVAATRRPEGWTGGLGVDLSAAPYGLAHEFGVTTSPHIIRPKNAAMLRWKGIGPPAPGQVGAPGGGFYIFARVVKHPGSKIPPRPYLRPAMEEGADAVLAAVEKSLVETKRRLIG